MQYESFSLVITPIKETNTCIIYNGSNRADVHRPRRTRIN